jgi:hypothetical protein
LNIHRSKRKILKVNATSTTPIKLKMARRLKRWRDSPIFGSIVDKQGRTDANVKIRDSIARAAFLQLKEVWTSIYLSTNTKIRVFNSNVRGRDL